MLIAHIQSRGTPVIVHLCGDLTSILPWLVKLGAHALSVDAATSVRAAKATAPELPIMGNLSTVKLHLGDPDSIATRAHQLLAEGVDILGPGCGLSHDTPLVNIQALTRTRGRKEGAASASAT